MKYVLSAASTFPSVFRTSGTTVNRLSRISRSPSPLLLPSSCRMFSCVDFTLTSPSPHFLPVVRESRKSDDTVVIQRSDRCHGRASNKNRFAFGVLLEFPFVRSKKFSLLCYFFFSIAARVRITICHLFKIRKLIATLEISTSPTDEKYSYLRLERYQICMMHVRVHACHFSRLFAYAYIFVIPNLVGLPIFNRTYYYYVFHCLIGLCVLRRLNVTILASPRLIVP